MGSFFHELPWSLAVLIIIIISFLFSIALTLLIRRFYPLYKGAVDKKLHIKTIDVSAVILGLLLGFAVLVSQTWYDAAEDVIATEAYLIQNSIRNANAFNHENKEEIQHAFREYIQYLLNQWNVFGVNKSAIKADAYIENIQNIYFKIPITTRKEEIAYFNVIQDLNSINQQRIRMEQLSSSSLHPVIWQLILFFSIILVMFILTCPIKSESYHYFLSCLYTLIVCILLLFLSKLEYPFYGDIHVSPIALNNLLLNISEEHPSK